ncbi:HlyD family efflux transporter periplasmic adaptor subunit [Fusibacter paucivorans]|uniref:HlyD family efflux transporter periplasmic adaptor subunit n=1 Tax=Fusibacter paucivorans TaxID=76009 RepID=A0ABS5PRB5_9FIRM|nr:HlyD family efflux transporter periplasmic adaptor subunit [Fusibacter paucivorans]MBS7527700.1 HlyD family efflux transporter periplasmic adaptor subunit [Fusibacter paucivorans]
MKRQLLIGLLLCAVMLTNSACTSKEAFRYTGFVEVDTTKITPLISGQLIALNAVEGDFVQSGDVIGEIDPATLKLSEEALAYQIQARKISMALMEDEIDDRDLASAREALDGASSQLSFARTSQRKAQEDYDQANVLFDAGAISKEQLKQASLNVDNAENSVNTLLAQYNQLALSYETLSEGVDTRKLDQIALEIKGLENEQATIQQQIDDTTIVAPVSGTLTALTINQSEFCVQGSPIGKISDLTKPYVIFYVGNDLLSKIEEGSVVNVYQDGITTPSEGIIYQIADEAQFTPKNVTVKEDRQQLVYEVKAHLPEDAGFLPGMMIDVEYPEQ